MESKGGRSKDNQRFNDVNKGIKGKLEEPSVLGSFSWRNYAGLYRWIAEFDDMILNLERTRPDFLDEYLLHTNVNGLYRVTEDHLDEGSGKRKKRERFRPNNDPLERERAVKYLKAKFEKMESQRGKRRGIVSENLRALIQKGIDGCSDEVVGNSKISSRRFFQDSLAEAADEEQCWDLLAGLLIYAQTGQLPENAQETAESRFPKLHANVFMGTKEEIQKKFSLESRYKGASLLVVINYAGTSFLTGKRIVDSPVYEESDDYDDWNVWFFNALQGKTKIRIVLTDPESAAAVDAEKYKMKPKNLKCDPEKIISTNVETLKNHMTQFPNCDLKAYLTEVALPCAYIKAEFEDHTMDNIKIDLYLPNYSVYKRDEWGNYSLKGCHSDDIIRQSFMIFRKDTPELYKSFSANIDAILGHAKELEVNKKK